MSGQPFLYSMLAGNLGEFADKYTQSILCIPNILHEVFVGLDLMDVFPTRSGVKRMAMIRDQERKELAKERPEYHEVSARDEMPVAPKGQLIKQHRDKYFPLLVVGTSLIAFDMLRGTFM
jgi:hypothetical protein